MASGSTLSYDQLEALWISKGGAPQLASTAAAVALAESSGWTGGPPSPTGDEGLWQINLAAWGLPPGQSDWYDPATNANEAVFIEQSATASNKSGHNEYIDGVLANFWDWAAFKSGAYKRFLQGEGRKPPGDRWGPPAGSVASGLVASISGADCRHRSNRGSCSIRRFKVSGRR